ncbi:MAG: tetratricopeptide repeat protein [Deltaproteobacteria bacterium]|nr:tetratricopeptide repeat protein [Deltaproteobacteria bacterium]
MSYINSALRKVQQERDSRYAKYGDFISSHREGRRDGFAAARSWRALAFPAAGAVILGILAVAAWFLYSAATATVKGSVVESPRTVAVAQHLPGQASPAAGQLLPSAVAGDDPARRDRSVQVYESALAAQRGKQWKEAESLYQQALSFDPRHVQALNNLGVLYMTQKRSEEAMELFIKAMAIQDGYVDPYYNLACLYSQLGKVRASLSYLERAIRIDGQVRKWAKQDNDFKKMRSLPEFNKITEELVK